MQDILDALIVWDKWLFTKINSEWTNSVLDAIFPYWRSRSTWLPVYLLLIAVVGWKYKKLGFFMLLAVLATVVVSNLISSELIKKMVERTRPCNDISMMVQMKTYFWSGEPMPCSGGFSFTSSHSTNHFALSTALTLIIPFFRTFKWRCLLYFWAFSIAYGQIYTGVHYPLDITCGAILGISTALLMYKLYDFLQRKGIIPTQLA